MPPCSCSRTARSTESIWPLTADGRSCRDRPMATEADRFHVFPAADIELARAAGEDAHSSGLHEAPLIGRHVGSVHTGAAMCSLAAGGHVDVHLHSTEQSFYVLSGSPQLSLHGRAYQLAPRDCGLLPVGVPHAWRADGGDAAWMEVTSPAPRLAGPPDKFWTGEAPRPDEMSSLDIRDPRTRTF